MRNDLIDRLILRVLRTNAHPARSQDIAKLLNFELGCNLSSHKVGSVLLRLRKAKIVSAAACKILESPNAHFPEWGTVVNIWFVGTRLDNLERIKRARAYAALHHMVPVPTYSKLQPATDDMRHMLERIKETESFYHGCLPSSSPRYPN